MARMTQPRMMADMESARGATPAPMSPNLGALIQLLTRAQMPVARAPGLEGANPEQMLQQLLQGGAMAPRPSPGALLQASMAAASGGRQGRNTSRRRVTGDAMKARAAAKGGGKGNFSNPAEEYDPTQNEE